MVHSSFCEPVMGILAFVLCILAIFCYCGGLIAMMVVYSDFLAACHHSSAYLTPLANNMLTNGGIYGKLHLYHHSSWSTGGRASYFPYIPP